MFNGLFGGNPSAGDYTPMNVTKIITMPNRVRKYLIDKGPYPIPKTQTQQEMAKEIHQSDERIKYQGLGDIAKGQGALDSIKNYNIHHHTALVDVPLDYHSRKRGETAVRKAELNELNENYGLYALRHKIPPAILLNEIKPFLGYMKRNLPIQRYNVPYVHNDETPQPPNPI